MRNLQKTAKNAALGTTALTVMLLASSGAWAQNCTSTPLISGLLELGSLAASTSSSIASSVGNVNTAFLAQQGSAFVSAPGNPPPSSPGGGVWVRGVGGEVEIKGSSASSVVFTAPGAQFTQTGTINCANREKEKFAGVQVGQDISRLNVDGWNFHLGTTAGYLESKGRELEGAGTFGTKFEVPFIGLYGVVTKGGFFADAMVRNEFYNIILDNPGFSLFNQAFGARGFSVAANAGYQMPLQNNWFIEPSAGVIWSRTKVDSFDAVGLPAPIPGNNISGRFALDDIQSRIGRATIRVGTSFTAGNLGLQPFASASVFREFADDITSTYQTCLNCIFLNPGGFPASATVNTSSTRVGTWGQLSLGVAGQVLNTGWLGFVRGDYRRGENLEGWTGNAGVRYQFVPEPPPVVAKGVFKAPPLPVVVPVNWTGFYVGGFFGADYGKSDIDFVGTVEGSDPRFAGWLGGGQVGFNYQVNRFVLGVEGDFGRTNASGSKACGVATGLDGRGFPTGAFSPFFLNCTNELDWVATLAGRIGVTWDRTLLYVKGGGAWTDETVSATCIIGPNNNPNNVRQCYNPGRVLVNGFSASDTRAGWMLGWGTEFALTQNWSAKAEYNFIRFGRHDLTASDGTLLNVRENVNAVKIGVNYRFGPAGAIVARY